MRHIRVGEHDLVDTLTRDDVCELFLRDDRYPLRITVPRKFGRIAAAVDVGDLGRSEGHDLDVLAAAERNVEVVEVAAGGAGDDDASH
jgi:hypothetical protein